LNRTGKQQKKFVGTFRREIVWVAFDPKLGLAMKFFLHVFFMRYRYQGQDGNGSI